MAIYRSIHLSFWEDSKIYDDFTPEDKYFYLWLLTNPKTNMVGCYEISFKKAQSELGYTRDVIENLLDRLVNYDSVKYNKKTREVLILNWHKYNWTKSSKLDKPLTKGIDNIKCLEFKEYLVEKYNNREDCIPYTYPIDTTVAVAVTNSITNVLDYLNNKLNKPEHQKYKQTNDTTKVIKARYNEGFTYEDFTQAIDNAYKHWSKTEDYKNMKPSTLFNGKFESRVNGYAYSWVEDNEIDVNDPFAGEF